MYAITLPQWGGTEVLTMSDVPLPALNADEILVKVRAVGLNRADILQRRGLYPPPAGASDIPGLELAGQIVEVGAAVTQLQPGQRVFGLVSGGAYADYVAMDAQCALLIPEDWSYEYAAAIPEAFMTADETLFQLARLAADESVLIHAGGSGVGSAAIQMAHSIGATVYTTAGSAEKVARAEALGATAGVVYKTADFAEVILELTEGAGVDVIEDFIGASYLARHLKLLKTGGRLVLVALMGGYKADIQLNTVLSKQLYILSVLMRSRPMTDKRIIAQRFAQRWLPLLQQGRLKPIIDRQFALQEIQAAHQYMEDSQHFGKIVITMP